MAGKKSTLVVAGVPRVNLMPRAENDRRERLALTRTWAILAIGAVVVALLVIAGSLFIRWTADQALAAEQARTATLAAEVESYAEVSQGLAAVSARESFRAEAMASDFAWTPLINSVVGVLPKGTTMIEYSLKPGLAPVADVDPATQVGADGTLTLITNDARAQAATVAAIAAVPGVLMVDAGDLSTSGEDSYEFTVRIAFDQTIYSGEFAPDEGAK